MSVRNEINVSVLFVRRNAVRLFVVPLSPREFFAKLSPAMSVAASRIVPYRADVERFIAPAELTLPEGGGRGRLFSAAGREMRSRTDLQDSSGIETRVLSQASYRRRAHAPSRSPPNLVWFGSILARERENASCAKLPSHKTQRRHYPILDAEILRRPRKRMNGQEGQREEGRGRRGHEPS